MAMLDRISIDPAVRFGKPCVRGSRVTVGEVLGHLAGGMSEAELLSSFPQLTHEDVLACLAYAAERERRTLSIPAA
ncbi:MAG: DUF433 domain-containing protein [Nitrospirota bacterium]